MALGNSLMSEYNQGFNSFLNPALLSQVQDLEAGMSYFPMSLDRYVQTFSISRSLSKNGGASLSLFNSGVSNIERRDSYNNSIGEFKSSEGYVMLSFGANIFEWRSLIDPNLSQKLSFGLNFKAIFNNIDEYSATGIAGDIGFFYKLSDNLALSVVLNNIFGKYVWDGLSEGSGSFEENIMAVNSVAFKYNMLSFIKSENIDISDVNFFTRVDYMNLDNLSLSRIRSGVEIGQVIDSNYKLNLRLGLIQNRGVEVFDGKILLGLGLKMKNFQFDYCLDFGKESEGVSHLYSISVAK